MPRGKPRPRRDTPPTTPTGRPHPEEEGEVEGRVNEDVRVHYREMIELGADEVGERRILNASSAFTRALEGLAETPRWRMFDSSTRWE
jgi:hypothetical protein